MHVYDSQYSEMLKPLSFTRTICRGGGGVLFNTLSSTYIPNRKKKSLNEETIEKESIEKVNFYVSVL